MGSAFWPPLYTKDMTLTFKQDGFALPTVLIASITMMIILLAALAATTSISTAVNTQYYNQLSKEAVESGIVMARACIERAGTPTWSDSSPLHPNTDCGGGSSCSSGDQCYVLNDSNVKTTFSVGTPQLKSDGSYLITATSSVQLFRTSNGAVWQTYSDSLTERLKIGWKQISVGYSFACGIAFDSHAYCWGDNGSGQLGNGTTAASSMPVAVSTSGAFGNRTIKSIASSLSTTCVIASDNNAYCWGDNTAGVLGNGSAVTYSSTPVAVTMPTGVTAKQISGGGRNFCIIGSDNNAYCWGRNDTANLGTSTEDTNAHPSPELVNPMQFSDDKTLTAISVGFEHACAVASGIGYCWGYGFYGQQGDGTIHGPDNERPTALSTSGALAGKTLVSISAGYYHTCAVASDGTGSCWGENSHGELGNGNNSNSILPASLYTTGVLSGKRISQISAGYFATCAVTSDSQVYCWGENANGQLGNGGSTDSNVPVAMDTSGALNSKAITAAVVGYSTSFVMTSENRFYATGANLSSVFGNGSSSPSSVPVLGGVPDSALTY